MAMRYPAVTALALRQGGQNVEVAGVVTRFSTAEEARQVSLQRAGTPRVRISSAGHLALSI
jgi:hypothetical protein